MEVQRGPRQSGRIRRPPDFYVPAAFTTTYDEVNDDLQYDDAKEDEDFPELDPDLHADPEHRLDISTMTVKEALASWKGKAVKAAMEEEIRSLVGMGTLVMKGFMQVYGTDYDKTYAPVSSYVMLRIFLSIIAVLDLNLMQLDMKNAFLQSKLDRVLYTHQPDYFNNGTGRGSQRCAAGCWLEEEPGRQGALLQSRRRKGDLLGTGLRASGGGVAAEGWLAAVRGDLDEAGHRLRLQQAGERPYYEERSALARIGVRGSNQSRQGGFAPSTADPSLFLRTDTSLPPFYVLVYVDDLVFATADTEALILVKSELQKRHTCTNLGEMRSYLGLQITWDRARRTITITQSHMVHQVLQRFSFQFSSPQPTPLSTGHSLSAPPSDESVELSSPYPELVGCLMYLMTCTRPDLVYPLSLLARYVAPVRWAWGSCLEDEVQFSSCEAEIYAGAMAAQELRWLTYLLTDLGEQPRSPPQRGQLRLAYVATRANTADVFTKALPPGDHQHFSTVLGLVPTLPGLLTA
ncbi:unnamed protein product [Closterium sp. NIES-53]